MSDDRGITWLDVRDAAPSWFDDLERLVPFFGELEEFARAPFAYVWELVIQGILYLWAAILSYLQFVMRQAILQPAYDTTYAILAVISTLVTAYLVVVGAIASSITSVILATGIAAPIAAVIGWSVPLLLTSAAVYFAIGVASTYLPIRPIVDQVSGLIPGGNR